MALVIVASALPMAVICSSAPATPGADPDYSVTLAGQRDPAAVHGIGLTYDVDDVAFGEWIALNADLAPFVKITDQAEIDAWTDTHDKYGYELFMDDPAAATEGLGDLRAVEELNEAERLATALVQHRAAEATLRQAMAAKATADVAVESATIARDEAEEEARAAQEVMASRPPPPPPVRPEPPQPVAGV
jgi:hypothetical protein